jgi:hypothetical protein
MFSKLSNFSGPLSPFNSVNTKLLLSLDSFYHNIYGNSFTFDPVASSGVTFSSNSVTSQNGGGWNDRGISVERIPLGSPFKLKFKRGETLGDIMCGVSQTPPINNDATYTRSSFGFYLGYGINPPESGLSITENGNFSINVVTNGSFPASTVYSIVYDGVKVKYYVNDSLFYTSSSVPTNDLFLYILFLQNDKSITDIEFGSTNPVWDETLGSFSLINSPKYLNTHLGNLKGVGSFYFNSGLSQYATGSDIGTLRKFTVDTWFNLKSLPEYNTNPQIVTNTYDNGHPYINFAIGFLNGNPIGDSWNYKISGGFFANAPHYWQYTAAFTPLVNTWYNVTLTYDQKHLNLYLNGGIYSSVTCSVPATTSGLGIDIGKRWDLSEFINGKIDVVDIWNGPLSPTQILDNYNSKSLRYVITPSSLQFNGSSSIEIPCGSDFALGTTYTIEFWSKASTSSVGRIYTVMSQRDRDFSIDIFYQDGNLVIRNGTTVRQEPTPGVWTHVAIVSNNSTLSVYYNGISQTVSGSGGNLSDSTYGLAIGCRGPLNNFQYFNGFLYGIRINNTVVYSGEFDPYDVALPPTNITGTILLIVENQSVAAGNFIDSSYNKSLTNRGVSLSLQLPTPLYRYYEWRIYGVYGGPDNMVQVGEFVFYNHGITGFATQSYVGLTVSNPPDDGNVLYGEGVTNLVDGSLSAKWLNLSTMVTNNETSVYFDFGTPSHFNSYRWSTAYDSDRYPERNPISWSIFASNDNSNWTTLHDVPSFTVNNVPNTWQQMQFFN